MHALQVGVVVLGNFPRERILVPLVERCSGLHLAKKVKSSRSSGSLLEAQALRLSAS